MSRILMGGLVFGLAVLALMSITNAGGQYAEVQQQLSTNRQTVTEQFATTTRFVASVVISCLVRGFLFRATQGLNVSVYFSYTNNFAQPPYTVIPAPIDLYVVPDSAFKGSNAMDPCHYTRGAVLRAELGINQSASFTLIFPHDGLYWFTFVDQADLGTNLLSFRLEAFPSVIITLAATPTPVVLISATSGIGTTSPLATGVPSVPFGTFGLIGIISGVAVISSILVVMRKRKNAGLGRETLGPRTEIKREARKAEDNIVRTSHTIDEKSTPTSPVPFAAVKQETRPESVSLKDVSKQTQMKTIPPIEEKDSASVVQPSTEIGTQEQQPARPLKISTGYGELDDLLHGGIPQGYTVVVVSPPFDERDLLLRRMIGSTLAVGQRVFYVSADLGRTQDLIRRFQTNFIAFCPDSHRISSGTQNLHDIPGIENLVEFNILLNKGLGEGLNVEEAKLLVMDLASDVLVRYRGTMTRKWLGDFIGKRRAQNFTTICTLSPAISSKEESSRITELFDGIIEICEKAEEGRMRHFLAVRKMYGQEYSESELHLDRSRLF